METINVSQAKQNLGKYLDSALRGEPVAIIRKNKIVILQAHEIPNPVPFYPEGYLEFTKEEAELDNKIAAQGFKGIIP